MSNKVSLILNNYTRNIYSQHSAYFQCCFKNNRAQTSAVSAPVWPRWPRARYLYGLDHPVGQLQGGHRCGGAEGSRASLETSDDAAVLPVLLYGQPDQVLQALDYNNQKESTFSHGAQNSGSVLTLEFSSSKWGHRGMCVSRHGGLLETLPVKTCKAIRKCTRGERRTLT